MCSQLESSNLKSNCGPSWLSGRNSQREEPLKFRHTVWTDSSENSQDIDNLFQFNECGGKLFTSDSEIQSL